MTVAGIATVTGTALRAAVPQARPRHRRPAPQMVPGAQLRNKPDEPSVVEQHDPARRSILQRDHHAGPVRPRFHGRQVPGDAAALPVPEVFPGSAVETPVRVASPARPVGVNGARTWVERPTPSRCRASRRSPLRARAPRRDQGRGPPSGSQGISRANHAGRRVGRGRKWPRGGPRLAPQTDVHPGDPNP